MEYHRIGNRDLVTRDWSRLPPVLPATDAPLISLEDQRIIMTGPLPLWADPRFDVYSVRYGRSPTMRGASAFLHRAIERGIFKGNLDWVVQEKYDGWYVIWDGARLLKKSGEPLQRKANRKKHIRYTVVDTWEQYLSKAVPGIPVSGEMHAGRGNLRFLGSHLKDGKVLYLTLFDIPFLSAYTYLARIQRLRALLDKVTDPGTISVAPYAIVKTMEHAMHVYKSIVYNTETAGFPWERRYINPNDKHVMAEGVILRMAAAPYTTGVTRTMIKLKAIALVCAKPLAGVPLPPDPYTYVDGDANADGTNDPDFVLADSSLRTDIGQEEILDDMISQRQHHSVCSTRVIAKPESAVRNWTSATHRRIRSRIHSCGASYTNGLTGHESGVHGAVLPRAITVSFRPLLLGYPVIGTLKFFPSCDQFIRTHRDEMGLFDPYRTNAVSPIYAWCHLYEACMGWNVSTQEPMLASAQKRPRTKLAETVLYIAGKTDVHKDPSVKRSAARKAIQVRKSGGLRHGFLPRYPSEPGWWPFAANEWIGAEAILPYTFAERVPDNIRQNMLPRKKKTQDIAAGSSRDDAKHTYKESSTNDGELLLMLMIFSPEFAADFVAKTRQKTQWNDRSLLQSFLVSVYNNDSNKQILLDNLRSMVDLVSVAIAVYKTTSSPVYTRNRLKGSVNTKTQAGLLALKNELTDFNGQLYIAKWNKLFEHDGIFTTAFKMANLSLRGENRKIEGSSLRDQFTQEYNKQHAKIEDKAENVAVLFTRMAGVLKTKSFEGQILYALGSFDNQKPHIPDTKTSRAASLLRMFSVEDTEILDKNEDIINDGCAAVAAEELEGESRAMSPSHLVSGVSIMKKSSLSAQQIYRLQLHGWKWPSQPSADTTAIQPAILQRWNNLYEEAGENQNADDENLAYTDVSAVGAMPRLHAPVGNKNLTKDGIHVLRNWFARRSDIVRPADYTYHKQCVYLVYALNGLVDIITTKDGKERLNTANGGVRFASIPDGGPARWTVVEVIFYETNKRVSNVQIDKVFSELRGINSKKVKVGDDRGVIFI
jgi:hypothetical protein